MAKEMNNWFWATLMPVFSPQPTRLRISPPQSLRPNPHVEAHNGLIVYSKHKDAIDFSSSVLGAMQAVAPVIVPEGVLKSSVWDGPKLFQDFILTNMASTSLSLSGWTAGAPSGTSPEKIYNEFVINTGLYIEDPLISATPGKIAPIVPNPDFNLAEVMLVFGQAGMLDSARMADFIKITGEEFYKLLLPDNYGFSTTLIFPDQDILNEDSQAEIDAAEIEKLRAYEEFIKILKEGHPDEWDPVDPYKKPKPWGDPTGPGAPWEPKLHRPNPYDPKPSDKNPYKWYPEDYDKYRSYLGKKKDGYDDEDRAWIKRQRAYYDKYRGAISGSGASAADQSHYK